MNVKRVAVGGVVLSFLLGATLLAWRRQHQYLQDERDKHHQQNGLRLTSYRSTKDILESDYTSPLRDSQRGT